MILYEYPFNERIRTYLRLEHLFLRLAELMTRESPLDHHFAIATMFEVMDVGARADLKSDVLKLANKGLYAEQKSRVGFLNSDFRFPTSVHALARGLEWPRRAGRSSRNAR